MIKTAYPYESGSLNGLIADLKLKLLLSSHINAAIIPQAENWEASNCLDRDPETFCHTTSTTSVAKYLQVQVKYIPFLLKGYAFQHRNPCYHGPKNWTLEGSLDGVLYHSIDSQYSENQCTGGLIRSFPVNNNQFSSYFRMVFHGTSCYGSTYFNLAEFELFGSFQSFDGAECSYHFQHLSTSILPILVSYLLLSYPLK